MRDRAAPAAWCSPARIRAGNARHRTAKWNGRAARPSRYQLWTIDGELLNLLYLIRTVKEGEYIFLGQRESKRRPDAPYYHRGMREDEMRDLVADGLLQRGLRRRGRRRNLRPGDFGGREGLRFDVVA